MKVLVVSDTHGHNETFLEAVEREAPLDMIIHCGDVEGSEYTIEAAAGCPVHMVAGNNDYFSDLEREEEFSIGRYRTLLTHGHNYYVSVGNETIVREAYARGMDILMYGHTHKPVAEWEGNLLVINPGSLSYPRQSNRRPSYVVLEIAGGGKPEAEICYL